MVEEKKQFQEQINILDNERLISEERKELLMVNIENIKERLLKHRLKHKILKEKLDEQTKKMDETYQKLFILNESLRSLQEPMNTALSFIELDASMLSFVNENKQQNSNNRGETNNMRTSWIGGGGVGATAAATRKRHIKPRERSKSFSVKKVGVEEKELNYSFIIKEIKKERFLLKRLKKESEEISNMK